MTGETIQSDHFPSPHTRTHTQAQVLLVVMEAVDPGTSGGEGPPALQVRHSR